MKTVLIIVVSVFIGFFFVLCLIRTVNTRSCKKVRRFSAKQEKRRTMETTKKVIWICLINGFAWVWCSYILAYLDKVQIAESLSQVAATEIIGVVLAYCIKSAVENLSKNNRWPDKFDSGQQEGEDNAERNNE